MFVYRDQGDKFTVMVNTECKWKNSEDLGYVDQQLCGPPSCQATPTLIDATKVSGLNKRQALQKCKTQAQVRPRKGF